MWPREVVNLKRINVTKLTLSLKKWISKNKRKKGKKWWNIAKINNKYKLVGFRCVIAEK